MRPSPKPKKYTRKPTGQLDERLQRIANTEKHFGMVCTDPRGGCNEVKPEPKSPEITADYASLFNEVL